MDIVSGRYVIDAKSIMGIFSTDLSKPVNVRVYAEGAEAEKALQIIRMMKNKKERVIMQKIYVKPKDCC